MDAVQALCALHVGTRVLLVTYWQGTTLLRRGAAADRAAKRSGSCETEKQTQVPAKLKNKIAIFNFWPKGKSENKLILHAVSVQRVQVRLHVRWRR
jgi:hypothetical protein